MKYFLEEAAGQIVEQALVGDVWSDIPDAMHIGAERLGYPTQKPEALLQRIIETSSNEGDLVLDPFCGCGTTLAVSERLKRRWIGVDASFAAIRMTRKRLDDSFGSAVSYEVINSGAGSRAEAKTVSRG